MNKPVFFIFNNKNSFDDFGIKMIDDITIPNPQPKSETISIPGGEDLVVKYGGYSDITIPVPIDILDKEIIKRKYRDIKNWLSDIKDNKLIFSNDSEVFYRVKQINLDSFKTEFIEMGSATINFICSPYTYYLDGILDIPLVPILFNDYGKEAKPIFHIKAEGLVTLTINNSSVELNVGQEITVDVERELIYKEGVINNSIKKGSWDSLVLKQGKNELSYSCDGTFNSITIIPNWRCL
ncbi:distal tail protein Dit [Clostridium thermobutyricum]|uniref:distal tail protein Dit n=1 Tax=Clostridium thermobutyricum TaxID=29372 RepID=UPI0018AB2087|nr:distal tail protein Dit [Clostridium thermobutyricum]